MMRVRIVKNELGLSSETRRAEARDMKGRELYVMGFLERGQAASFPTS